MPHIVLNNISDLEMFYKNFKKDVLTVKNEKKDQTNIIIRFDDIFLNQLKSLILIKTIVIENTTNQPQTYYIMITKKIIIKLLLDLIH